jgi:hypothetical protein
VGERSYQESLQDVEGTLRNLKVVLDETSPGDQMRSQVVTELANVTRRIQLLTYAARKSRDQRHMQWHQEVSHQVRGDGHVEGIEYTPEELRSRARVS